MRPVRLIPLGGVDRTLIDAARLAVVREFAVGCRAAATAVDPAFAFHPERGQYHSTSIVERLGTMNGDEIVVGVTAVDLFIPILTYVFGEARMNGSSAVVSFHRFMQEFYGLPSDPQLTAERFAKTIVHEIGHTLGLTHCEDYECVMAASHSVEYLDLKSRAFCDHCRILQQHR